MAARSVASAGPFLPIRKDEEKETAETEIPTEEPGSLRLGTVACVTAVCLLLVIGSVEHKRINAAIQVFLVWCKGLGWAAPVLVALLVAAMSLLMLPTFPLMVGAGVIFPRMYGMVLGEIIGCLSIFFGLWLGSVAAFQLGRTFFRDWAQEELQKYAWMGVVNSMIEEQGWTVVLLARMSPVLPAEVFNYACSLTSISLAGYAVGCLGSLVPISFWVCSTAALDSSVSSSGDQTPEQRKEKEEFGAVLLVLNIIILGALSSVLYSGYRKYKAKCDAHAMDEVERQAMHLGVDLDDHSRRHAEILLADSVNSLSRHATSLAGNVFRFAGASPSPAATSRR